MDSRCPASLASTWSSLQAFGFNDSARWACTEDGNFETLDTPARKVQGVSRSAAFNPTADACRSMQWNAMSGNAASHGPAVLGLDGDIIAALERRYNQSFTRLALPWSLERASKRHWQGLDGTSPQAFTSCANAMFVVCASRGWLPEQDGPRFLLASLGRELVGRCKAACAQPAAGLCWNECYYVLSEWCMLTHLCINGGEAWSQRGDWVCSPAGRGPALHRSRSIAAPLAAKTTGEAHERTCSLGTDVRARSVPAYCFQLDATECEEHWLSQPTTGARFACTVANGSCVRGDACREDALSPLLNSTPDLSYDASDEPPHWLPGPRWSCPARVEATHDAVCQVSSAETSAQHTWLDRIQRKPAPELIAYLRRVYGLHVLPETAVHADGLMFFWHTAPHASERAVRWVCAVCEDLLPIGSLWAPHDEAKLNPYLLAPGSCGKRTGQDMTECRLGHLKGTYNVSKLRFPGFFVHRFDPGAATFRSSVRTQGVPDHSFVEVMRVARVENKFGSTPSASNGRSACTRGQVWFWLATGSGIWTDVGRSLRLRNIKESADGCRGARRAGYDSIQLMQSMRGLTFELVDCRASTPSGDDEAWEDACPPAHVQLRKGLPMARYSPVLDRGLRGPSTACVCDRARDYLNCEG